MSQVLELGEQETTLVAEWLESGRGEGSRLDPVHRNGRLACGRKEGVWIRTRIAPPALPPRAYSGEVERCCEPSIFLFWANLQRLGELGAVWSKHTKSAVQHS